MFKVQHHAYVSGLDSEIWTTDDINEAHKIALAKSFSFNVMVEEYR